MMLAINDVTYRIGVFGGLGFGVYAAWRFRAYVNVTISLEPQSPKLKLVSLLLVLAVNPPAL